MNPRISALYPRLKKFLTDPAEPFLFVDPAAGRLYVCSGETVVAGYDVSTAARGLGNREGSHRTPTGVHRIREKIGHGAPAGRIFRDRIDTGCDWREGMEGENQILTRIMRLEGMEPGLNRGPGIDSFDRYIYIHGTNREAQVGSPLTHGCIVMRNRECIELFDAVREGTVVFIDALPFSIGALPCSHIHFTGILGSGMSALAQYLQWQGVMVSGSDRLLASPDTQSIRSHLADLGCNLFEQDGSGITASTDALCVSTAIEESNPDIRAAREASIPILHRSDLLAAIVQSRTTIAVAGTSGKSTVTAMIFELLSHCGKAPSLISGAALLRLEQAGLLGNAYAGKSDLLVIEADESDGTLVKYQPAASVILNISRDHKGVEEVESLFLTLAQRSAWTAVNADDAGLARIPAQVRYGTKTPSNQTASWKPEDIQNAPVSVTVIRNGVRMELPLPGAHNAENLCAALCVCEHFGCTAEQLAEAVRGYRGVARRFAVTRTGLGVYIVDDFAHNPAKIAAAVSAARGLSQRIIAIYQPHGFGPTRFLRAEYVKTFLSTFTESDALLLLPIYYAGGTAVKDISSADIISDLGEVPFDARAVGSREELLGILPSITKPGDCILLMGARDPSLPTLAKAIAVLFDNGADADPVEPSGRS